jgi:hypothetical protein
MKPFSIVLSICAAGLAAGLAMTSPALGQNYPWCSNFHDGAGTNCGFSSYEQCMATARGSGGSCTKNDAYASPAGSPPARRVPHKHRPGDHF